MKKLILNSIGIGSALASMICAQGLQRQATIVGTSNPNGGKCTVEVVVDGAAQVEIRGTTASLRDLNGRQPQWRRFECTGAMPSNPANFRFEGVDGRGRQTLVRDPRNGGAAVVQLEDPSGGAEGYTFDIMWGDSRGDVGRNYDNAPGYPNGQYRERTGSGDPTWGDPGYRPNWRDSEYYRQYGHGFGRDEAIRVCREAIYDRARQRFGTNNVHILRTRIDDNPGRNDWVIGHIDVHPNRPGQVYGFSCSVNFDNGRIRSAEIDARPTGWDPRWR
jgi:hypothetical protein